MIGSIFKDPLGKEWTILTTHPMKDECLMIDTEGFTRWIKYFDLMTRWKIDHHD